VRDSLLRLAVSDIDLATPLRPQEVVRRLEHDRIKAIPTGIEYGTITAVANGQRIEVTTLRRDVSTDGRRATVAFSNDWREDAARRDFTINALYADPESGQIYDYFRGLQDLQDRKLRFIGEASQRIAEDHLRILRFFRFHARFGEGKPDAKAIIACEAAAKCLMALSRERIADELMKLLALTNPVASLALMLEHKIFEAFLPEVGKDSIEQLERLLGRELACGKAISAGRRLNALLPNDPAIVELVAARLKLSNRTRGELTDRLADISPEPAKASALAYRLGTEMAADLFLLHGRDEDWQAGIAAISGWTPPTFPIKGGDLVALGLTAGPVVAKTLQAVERQWVEEGFPDAARASAIADQCVAEMLAERKE
jgi:poly(A) polymerase